MSDRACGIICEYNPFHNGHRYQLEQVQESLGLPVVCAMSGSFVQRAEPAFADKRFRAEQAVRYGAKLVLEIPFPYSCMSAECFAETGVRLLSETGLCSHIAFGSECADVGLLTAIAEALCDEELCRTIVLLQKEQPALSYAMARQRVLERFFGEKAQVSATPNDILGIEYIKAIRKNGYDLIPVALKRTTERAEQVRGTFASSSYIRQILRKGATAEEYLPDKEVLHHRVDAAVFETMLHMLLCARSPEELKHSCEYTGGLERAVSRAARESESYAELFERLKSKTLTDAKIRRMLLFGAFGVPQNARKEPLLYAYILASASDEQTRTLLRAARARKEMLLAHRVSTIRKVLPAWRQYEKNAWAEHMLRLSEHEIHNKEKSRGEE